MFERFTEKARRVMYFAYHEARQFRSPFIEPEHILLALLREDPSLSARIQRANVSMESIRERIEEHQSVRIFRLGSADIPLSEESKRTLAYAAEEADRLAHEHIETGHLILGMLREEKSLAAEILRGCQFELTKFRDDLSREPPEPENPTNG